MVKFKVIERLMKIGPLKGKKGYGAAPKAQEKFSQSWLIQRIVGIPGRYVISCNPFPIVPPSPKPCRESFLQTACRE